MKAREYGVHIALLPYKSKIKGQKRPEKSGIGKFGTIKITPYI